MDFLYDEILDDRFQLAYASVTSEAGAGFSPFWSETVAAHLEICGYDLSQSMAIFAVAATGEERHAFGLDSEVADALPSGLSVDEAVALLASSVSSNISNPKQAIYSGYCLDPCLHDRISLSLWFFLRNGENSRH